MTRSGNWSGSIVDGGEGKASCLALLAALECWSGVESSGCRGEVDEVGGPASRCS